MKRTTLKIDGMSCGHCVTSVKKALESIDGVAATEVAVGKATVEFDSVATSVEGLIEAVSGAGYFAVPLA